MKRKTMTAKEIVKKYHIPYHTLNYYTTIGLLPISSKTGNQRHYDAQEAKRRLQKVSRLIKDGYPLNLIRKKLVGI